MTETESRLYDVDELDSADDQGDDDAEARSCGSTEVAVTELRVEHRRPGDTVGIGEGSPRLSWMTTTERQGWSQAAYEIEVTRSGERRPWSSGRVDSAESVLVPWPATPLASRDRCSVRVRVWGRDGSASRWSLPTVVEAGLLEPLDWSARFVTSGLTNDGGESMGGTCPLLRRSFEITGPVERARLYVTALGVYEIELNGRRVGDQVLAPGWSSYQHRLHYETFDVTDLVRPGLNAIGALLAEGWYRGRFGFGPNRQRRTRYGDRLALLTQLEIVGRDGATQLVVTGDSWRSGTGPLLSASIYDGETYDARQEQPGWSEPGFDDRAWSEVRVLDDDLAWRDRLVARTGPPVRRTELRRPVSITSSASGRSIVDFGQVMVGCPRLTVVGPAGTHVTLRHAEVLQDGELCTEPLRGAAATDHYILRGGQPEEWEPRFTFHSFRYVEIDGWPGELGADDIVAVVRHSDMERTGWFECSDERINRLHDNIVWGMRGNFLDLPTDCPNRDERLGWTGDIQVFAPTASFLYDCAGLLASWLCDLAADQYPSGAVPWVIPDAYEHKLTASGWGDAATIVPWVIYQRFGDHEVPARQYASMRAWVGFVLDKAGPARLWCDGFQFGDWLDPHAPADNPFDARTDAHLVANAYLCRSLDIISETAELLGDTDQARHYQELATQVREAFVREYVTPAGRVASDSQTAYAMALDFGLLPTPEARTRAGRRLAQLVESHGHKIATGFLGTPLVCDALCETGHADTAFRLLMQDQCPSWLYPLTRGATTIWERWDGILPHGRVNPGNQWMNSFNHYAFGAVGDWLHRTVGGLAPDEPGYRRLRIAPLPGGGLTWARTRHRTPYGLAESSWHLAEDGTIEITAVVPPNTTAVVVLPGTTAAPITVGSGTHQWRYHYTSEGGDE